ncbi:baseplate assembly protein [Clostridium butyricum]|uniref:baseplate assembly protein n=1 Tax=Clostridium butyricum TaxID=1492 RepID=UPI003D336F29
MSDVINLINNLPDVSFIDNRTLEDVKNEMINDFIDEHYRLTGKKITLALADPNRLILYTASLQIYQIFQCVDKAGKMNLLKYATGDFLDYLAALKGVARKGKIKAKTTIRFTLSEIKKYNIGIASGTRVTNGDLYFITPDYAEIKAGDLYADVEVECLTAGAVGNGYLSGELNILVDSVPYCSSVKNIEKTYGGADIENDESLKERIYLAPSGYSTAGPDAAYEYWIKTFNTKISDTKVYSPTPGSVDIRCILSDGELPSEEELKELNNLMSNKKIRPLTDNVTVKAPDIIKYNIDLTYYISDSDPEIAISIQRRVNEEIEKYIIWQQSKISRDINPSNLIAHVIRGGAKRVELNLPERIVLSNTQIGSLDKKNIIYGGLEDD